MISSPSWDEAPSSSPIRVILLGSTGSIGLSTLEILRRHPDRFQVVGLSAHRNLERLAAQAAEHRVSRVVVSDEATFLQSRERLPAEWRGGRDAVLELAGSGEADVVVNAVVGFAGLEPTLAALESGVRVALANKESLVAGGGLVRRALERGGGHLVPVDSEHSAILQCLQGASPREVQRILLTASGGPFRGWSRARLEHIGPAEALRHPTWDMGAKITIDSATLANKALEVIEAHVLYQIPYERIEAVVHPQSVIHSFVEFVDGSVLAQLGFPTMELPILYALTYPRRVADPVLSTFDPVRAGSLTFEPVDLEAFPLFRVGVDAGRAGGAAPVAFNAGNEVAVDAFLNRRLSFPGMADAVSAAVEASRGWGVDTLDDVRAADAEARRVALSWISLNGAPPRAGNSA
jgi:1-deoxy-D-xylulose-5-phosphate reductoisomerase